MAEWQPYLQSIIIGFIFSFLLAKLFSIIFAFRDDNLRIARADSAELGDAVAESEDSSAAEIPRVSEEEKLIGEEERAKYDTSSVDDSDDDWEGVESTELDEAFSAATAFVATTAADRSASKVSNDLQLQLYAFYKIATEGPCSTPQPSAIKMTARAKWQAWKKLGAMPPEEAMQKYIAIVTELFPTWLDGAPVKRKSEGSDTQHVDSKGPMGPVFSSHVYEEESADNIKLDAIHAFAREGELDSLIKRIESGVSVDLKDSEGRTALHWAVDRGHLNITEALVKEKADINAKDNEGQTPLHYAAVCERESIAKFLVKENADMNIKDDENNRPSDLCDLNWPWMQHTETE
ncbi:hypothetical protein DCAR_0626075 [Daucus carota subsp. sativus]|uniref:Uncharacterized protein n=1 Tax=Daucus carota subsp. sativus TaxID=79200 RepID=A0A161WUM7_DAUCS|nr:PREDICTED: acyl-CoA-binding domain-containing protein 1 [Daucus carota subsp. sativus]WOH06647.1 hypothetical protein DCAR_0626075 [Daucus carota subsp. sativus]